MSKNQPPLKLDDLGSFIKALTSDKSDQKAVVSSVQQQAIIKEKSPEQVTQERHLVELLQIEGDKSGDLSNQVQSLQKQLQDADAQISSLQENLKKQNDALAIQVGIVENDKQDLAEKKKKLFEDLKLLQQESEKIAEMKAEMAPLTDLKSEVKKLRSENTRCKNKVIELNLTIGELETKNQQIEHDRDKFKEQRRLAKAEIKDLRGNIATLKGEIKATRSRLTKTSNDKVKIETELEALHQSFDSEMHIRSFATVEWLVESGVENHGIAADRNITITGDGPWEEDDLVTLLKRIGYKPMRAGKRGSGNNEVIVVGRDADLDLVEAHISGRDDKTVRLFPQELFIASIACGSDPFDLIDSDDEESEIPEFLTAFGQGHPVIEYLRELQFPWPKLGYDGGELPPLEQVEKSPLVLLGYHVGKVKGLSPRRRWEILEAAYHDEDLPRVDLPKKDCDEYMQNWGNASSRKRLRRMACHITWLIRKNRTRDSLDQSVEEWSGDLEWLKDRFYNRVMRFEWPMI